MAPLDLAWPVSWFLLSGLFFFLSLRQRARPPRIALAALHLLAVGVCLLWSDFEVFGKIAPLAVPFVIGMAVHTVSILFFDLQTTTADLPFVDQLSATVLVLSNIRRLERRRGPQPAAAPLTQDLRARLSFGLGQLLRALAFWLLDRLVYEILITRTLGSLPIGVHSFAPAKQALFPGVPWASPSHFSRTDFILRAITCTHWIWSTYAVLTAAYHFSAAVFVSVLSWDSPETWKSRPPLFGSVWDAYTLRRFWGVFWQRLHVAAFSSYTPSQVPKELRALWFFLLSAGGHALANWVLYRRTCALSELRFFVSNWAVCVVETVLGLGGRKAAAKPGGAVASWGRRIAGLGFVWAFFFCTVPAWQYPIVLATM